jgi:hypothetical protein
MPARGYHEIGSNAGGLAGFAQFPPRRRTRENPLFKPARRSHPHIGGMIRSRAVSSSFPGTGRPPIEAGLLHYWSRFGGSTSQPSSVLPLRIDHLDQIHIDQGELEQQVALIGVSSVVRVG